MRRDIVWVGTETGGVGRYDPVAQSITAVADPGHPGRALGEGTEVRALAVDGAGTVWVGTLGGGLLAYDPEQAAVRAFLTSDENPVSLPSDSVRALWIDGSGTVWAGTTMGIARLNPLDATVEAFELRDGNATIGVNALSEVRGILWAAGDDGALWRFNETAQLFERRPIWPEGEASSLRTVAASTRTPSVLWIGTGGRGLLRYDTATGRSEVVNGGPLGEADVLALHEDTEGLLWIGTHTGLVRLDLHGPRFDTYDNGTARPVTDPIVTLYEAPSTPALTWAGVLRGGVLRFDRYTNARLRAFDNATHPLDVPFAFHEDATRTLWAAGTDIALYAIDQQTLASERIDLGASRSGVVRFLYVAPSQPDIIWVSTSSAGLIAFDPTERRVVARVDVESGALPTDDVWRVYEAAERPGTLWIGTHNGGLHQLDLARGAVVPVEATSGCAISTRVVSMVSDGNALWIGTFDEGLQRYAFDTGACQALRPDHGFPYRDAGALFLDARRRLWISSNDGLGVYDLQRDALTTFTEADGLQGTMFTFHAAQQKPDGTLLLGGMNGFHRFDPLAVPIDTTAPPIAVTGLLVDGEPTLLPTDGETLVLRPDQRDLTFTYAALSLRQPEKNQYRIWLEGAEDTWRHVGNTTEERYARLAPGAYVFHVTGTNADGYWNPTGVRVPFRIRPPAWQTWWFWALAALAVLGVVVAAYQYRIQQLVRVERTRIRIADDLHDDIGSKVSNVALRLDLVGRSAGLPDGERAHLADLAQTARSVVDDLRDAVWIVDAGHDDLAAVAMRMEQFAESMLRGRSYAFACQHPGRDRLPSIPLDMETRRHLYLLFKEALHNAVRHGQAERVDITLTHAGGYLRLVIADDGRGFDPATVQQGRGLTTMRTRANALDGTLQIESARDTGTTVTFSMPLA
ncbi:MAG: ATP-binding protein [Bacteroidota bacterium]